MAVGSGWSFEPSSMRQWPVHFLSTQFCSCLDSLKVCEGGDADGRDAASCYADSLKVARMQGVRGTPREEMGGPVEIEFFEIL